MTVWIALAIAAAVAAGVTAATAPWWPADHEQDLARDVAVVLLGVAAVAMLAALGTSLSGT